MKQYSSANFYLANFYLTNSLTHKKEIFTALDPQHVTLYLCGPTVYDRPHIGNARSAVAFDVLYRLLKVLYSKVTFVRNVTDVDDKINARAKELGCSIQDLTKITLQYYHDDMGALGVLPPDIEPRATEHIPHMIEMIQTLIDKGHGYVAQGHVLFDVSSNVTYGSLSRKKQEDLIAGARVEVAPYKRNPADFVLWKPSDAETPGWDSPFGFGRPGWHIECSAMSAAYLGKTFDIHAGGIDLVFPHHENEIAQSCCANDTPYMARYWLHNGHLTVGGSKMSKSEGNFITVRDLLTDQSNAFDGEVIRLALLQSHYRGPLDWNHDLLVNSKRVLDRFYGALDLVNVPVEASQIPEPVMIYLLDDLNVPGALSVLHELAGKIFKDAATLPASELMRLGAELKASGNLLGLLERSPEQWFKGIQKTGANFEESSKELSASQIEALIDARNQAKAAKDFARADEIRQLLLDKGYVLLDTQAGTTWRRK